jgi:hypothetical protein
MDLARGIVLVGLAGALAVYFTARAPGSGPLGDPLEDSKIYQRTLEVYGGTANLVASQIREGLLGLWRGRTLAYTLAVLTLVVAGAFLLATEDVPRR